MGLTAVPSRLGSDFSGATPSLRFGMYLPVVYTRRGDKIDADNKLGAWKNVSDLTTVDVECIRALRERQAALASPMIASGEMLVLDARAVSPFATGLGNAHPLENGFAFLDPYGVPYLPGSGLKGVIRTAATELGNGLWGDTAGWNDECVETLFGTAADNDATRGALTFWDTVPEIEGGRLHLEIMTGHQKHYYQDKEPPHESGKPNPVYFLTVPAGSAFTFHVSCNLRFLESRDKVLADDGRWRALLEAAFQHAFQWLGFGAKTAVGYGIMHPDHALAERRENEANEALARAERERELSEITAGLPADAAALERERMEGSWAGNDAFLDAAESLLATQETPSDAALALLREEMNSRWPGILANPDAVQGRRNKPKFKGRSKALAQRIRLGS